MAFSACKQVSGDFEALLNRGEGEARPRPVSLKGLNLRSNSTLRTQSSATPGASAEQSAADSPTAKSKPVQEQVITSSQQPFLVSNEPQPDDDCHAEPAQQQALPAAASDLESAESAACFPAADELQSLKQAASTPWDGTPEQIGETPSQQELSHTALEPAHLAADNSVLAQAVGLPGCTMSGHEEGEGPAFSGTSLQSTRSQPGLPAETSFLADNHKQEAVPAQLDTASNTHGPLTELVVNNGSNISSGQHLIDDHASKTLSPPALAVGEPASEPQSARSTEEQDADTNAARLIDHSHNAAAQPVLAEQPNQSESAQQHVAALTSHSDEKALDHQLSTPAQASSPSASDTAAPVAIAPIPADKPDHPQLEEHDQMLPPNDDEAIPELDSHVPSPSCSSTIEEHPEQAAGLQEVQINHQHPQLRSQLQHSRISS